MSAKYIEPAFPTYERGNTAGLDTGLDLTNCGMTLRDYFAAKAMQSLLANDMYDHTDRAALAELAYMNADAMLKAREVQS